MIVPKTLNHACDRGSHTNITHHATTIMRPPSCDHHHATTIIRPSSCDHHHTTTVTHHVRILLLITTTTIIITTTKYTTITRATHTPTAPTHHHLHQAHEEACASATESTPAVEEALRFYASSGDEARLTALLERGIVNVMATDEVGAWVGEWAVGGGRRVVNVWVGSFMTHCTHHHRRTHHHHHHHHHHHPIGESGSW